MRGKPAFNARLSRSLHAGRSLGPGGGDLQCRGVSLGPEAASPAFVRCEIMARCFSPSAA